MTVHVLNTRVLFKHRVYNIELQGISTMGVKIPIYRAVAVNAHLPHFPSSHVSVSSHLPHSRSSHVSSQCALTTLSLVTRLLRSTLHALTRIDALTCLTSVVVQLVAMVTLLGTVQLRTGAHCNKIS